MRAVQYDDDAASEPQEPEYEGLGLERYKAWWKEWVDNYADARRQSFRDEEYYDGDIKGTGEGHWLAKQLDTLADRKQPPSVFNLIKRKINSIAGVEQRSRSEPRGLPRNPKDQYAAEIATDALRYIKEQTRFPMTAATAFLEALKVGYTACEIGGAEDCVPIEGGEWRDYFFDPRSRKWDFSDVRYHGWAKWLDQDVAIETYAPEVPEPQIPPQPQTNDPMLLMQWQMQAQAVISEYQQAVERQQRIQAAIEQTASGAGSDALTLGDSNYEDQPASTFCDKTRKRIFVIDMWHRDPKHGWYRCVFTGAGKLVTEPATLIEKDQWGRKRPTHPIQSFSVYVSKNGWRYGEIRGMRSPQDEVNMRRSKALHLLTVNQIITKPGNYGADGNKETLRSEAAKPDGILEVSDPQNFKLEKNTDLAAGQQRLGEEARAFMELEGANPQLQGQQGSATSGRMFLAQQQAGLGALGPIFDRFHDWEDRCYRSMWFRVQQFWTKPMYVRVTDDKNSAKFAAVNGAPTLDDNGQPKRPPPMDGMAPAMPPGGPQSPMQGGAIAPMDGAEGSVTNQQYEGPMLAELDMDIIIDRAPEAATLQAEQFEELAKLLSTGALGPPSPDMARMIVTASALPTKTEILDMLDKVAQAPKQPNPQEMGELKKLMAQIELLMAQRDKTRAETAKTGASIPGVQAQTAKTGAEARTASVEATLNEVSAQSAMHAFDALTQRTGGPPINGPMAAASLPGASGLPPQQANGPPPF